MRKLAPYFIVGFAIAVLCGWLLDPVRIFQVFQPITVCLSIMAAAIFVRLNRGMPSLEWKSLTVTQRKEITAAVFKLAKDYVIGLISTSVSIVTVIVLSGIGKEDIQAYSPLAKEFVSFSFALSVAVTLVWMGYVIWRDLDIVRLQKRIIDDAAEREEREQQAKLAEEMSNAMKASRVDVAATPIRSWQ